MARCNPNWNPFDFSIFKAKASKSDSKEAAVGLKMIVQEWKEMKGKKVIDKLLADKKEKDERENKLKCE